MSVQSFLQVPTGKFMVRWALVVTPAVFAGLLAVGILAQVEPFNQRVEAPKGVDFSGEEVPWVQSWWPPTVARNHYSRIYSYVANFPQVCWPGQEINQFQAQQCDQFRERLSWGAGLCLLPFVILLLGLSSGNGKIQTLYRNSAQAMAKSKPIAQGIVTDPPHGAIDFFSWLYCLQPVSIQLPDKRQITVYLGPAAPIPLPGQKFWVYDLGQHYGKKRHTGMLHAPHLAVVAGSR